MRCPKCGSIGYCYATKDHGSTKQRYRVCRTCGARFTTYEEPQNRAIRKYERKKTTGDLFDHIDNKEAD